MKIQYIPWRHMSPMLCAMDDVPVVELEEVDAVLKEAVWAAELAKSWTGEEDEQRRLQDFLASQVVTEWRKR